MNKIHIVAHDSSMIFTAALLLMLMMMLTGTGAADTGVRHHDYVIVGAGPAGLQMAYFYEKRRRDYVIVERNSVPGSFFEKYPRHDTLISINKVYTTERNEEFNFRHDWNSLISDNLALRYKHYSKEFFPSRHTMLKYLKDYENLNKLKVQYNTTIMDIQKLENSKSNFQLYDQHGNIITCKYLLLATGMYVPNELRMRGAKYVTDYSRMSTDPRDYEGKAVLIIGNGNSGFETADGIIASTSRIQILGRRRIKLAWATHYVGDLRAVNNQLLDTYQLKSLDGIVEGDTSDGRIVKLPDGRLKIVFTDGATVLQDNHALREPYDVIISCLGFQYNHSIYRNLISKEGRFPKYPKLNSDHSLVQDVYVIGASAHGIDFRKSAGGFIHGYRYTTRMTNRIMEWRNHGVPWPSRTRPMSSLHSHLVARLNSVSANYQMTHLLVDVLLLDTMRMTFDYLEEISVRTLDDIWSTTGHNATRVLLVRLEYGVSFSDEANDVFSEGRARGSVEDAHNSNFLHPVLYYYDNIKHVSTLFDNAELILPQADEVLHLCEDFHTMFWSPVTHQQTLTSFLSLVLDLDFRKFFAEECAMFTMTMVKVPEYCRNVLDGEIQPISNNNINGLYT